MTKSTVTTEELKTIIREYGKNSIHHKIAAELLAVREAQSVEVSETELNDALRLHHLKTDGHSQLADSFRNGFKYARRTAPPAPAPVKVTLHEGHMTLASGCSADDVERILGLGDKPCTQTN